MAKSKLGPMAPVEETLNLLKKEYPNPVIALNYQGVFQLLVAVILSAQCTDERVNMVTPKLFERFPDAQAMAAADLAELERLIYSTGFYKNKAKNIKAAAVMIRERYDGEVPDEMEDLLKLPGVARKTANVVLNAGYNKQVGIVVDTHVARLAGLLHWVSLEESRKKQAIKIEKKLMKLTPKADWGVLSYLLILHGRKICIARRPQCEKCSLNSLCPSSKV